MQESVTVFKNSMRKKPLELQNETSHFSVKLLKKLKTGSSCPNVFFGKVALKLLVFSGKSLWWSVIFVNHYING